MVHANIHSAQQSIFHSAYKHSFCTPRHFTYCIQNSFCTQKHISYHIKAYILHTKAFYIFHTKFILNTKAYYIAHAKHLYCIFQVSSWQSRVQSLQDSIKPLHLALLHDILYHPSFWWVKARNAGTVSAACFFCCSPKRNLSYPGL